MSEALTTGEPVEARAIARHMAENYRQSLAYQMDRHRRHTKLNYSEAAEQAERSAYDMRNPSPEHVERIHATPLDELDWFALETLELNQEGEGWEKWQQIKGQAREELLNGVYGTEIVIDRFANPLKRARYAVLREELTKQWQPRDFIEQTLIEQLAQTYFLYTRWIHISACWAFREMETLSKYEAEYSPPRLSDKQAEEHALAMADKFHRLFQRTLRALRDMRRYAPVIVQNAGQVNVGAQQVNIGPPVLPEAPSLP